MPWKNFSALHHSEHSFSIELGSLINSVFSRLQSLLSLPKTNEARLSTETWIVFCKVNFPEDDVLTKTRDNKHFFQTEVQKEQRTKSGKLLLQLFIYSPMTEKYSSILLLLFRYTPLSPTPPTGTRCQELLSPGRSVCRNFFWFQSRKWERLEISSFVCSRKLH